jgi:Putative beta barrel porin-7 (BBP7)
MSNHYFATLASLFVAAGMAWGQSSDNRQGPALEPAPPPTALPATESPSLPAPVEGSTTPRLFPSISVHGVCDGLKGCLCGDACHPAGGLFTVDAEYLLWFLANSHDSSVVASTDLLTNPGVQILGALGDAEHPKRAPTSGGRIALGYWQTTENFWIPEGIRDWGAETVFFFVGQRGASVTVDRSPVLLRPFFDINNRQESAFIVAVPGISTGSITGHAQANLWGGEANAWKNLYFNCPGTTCTLAMMAGFRFLDADQSLQINSTSVFNPVLPPASPFLAFAGNKLNVFDSFTTHNHFYGGQLGIAAKAWLMGHLCLETTFKLALGVTSEDLEIVGGQFRTFANGTTQSYTGGLLALPSNIGDHHRDKFAQVPELDVKVSYPVMSHLTLSTGFSALYWSRIARAGQQIDREIDSQFPARRWGCSHWFGTPRRPLCAIRPLGTRHKSWLGTQMVSARPGS